MPMARCRRMSIGSNSPQTVLSPKNCYRRSTSSNTQSVAKKKGKTLAVTWLLSRWSRTWKQKVQILSSQDSAVVVPPFHRAEILTSFSLSASPMLQLYIYEQHFEKLLCLPHNTHFFSYVAIFWIKSWNPTLFQCLTRLCFGFFLLF